ncbi:MAG: ABC transporter permease, partial [Gammaproteobacteria bacterium]
ISLVLREALWLGLAGTAAGLLLGHWLGGGLVTLVLRTIEDLWFTGQVAAVAASPWVYVKGALLGLGATVLAGLAPALEAGALPPRAILSRAELERRTRRRLPWLTFAGLAAAVVATLLLAGSERSLAGSFAGLFGVIAAAALVTPTLTLLLLRAAAAPAGWIGGLPGRLAARGAAASLSRTAVAVAALSTAVATVIGVSVMIGSFRGSVERWLDLTLQADFHLRLEAAPPANPGGAALSAELIESVTALPGVADLSLSRWRRMPTTGGELLLRAHRPGPRGWGLELMEGAPAAALRALVASEGVVISEPLARRRGLGAGSSLELPTMSGTLRLPVLGVFRDYSSDRGAVVMHLDLYRRHWQDQGLSGIGIYLGPGADAGAVHRSLEALAATDPTLWFNATAELRATSLAIFERTFTITKVLRWLAGLVAFFGILAALMALALERAREAAVLRALGFTPGQMRGHLLAQTGLLGLASGLIAMPVGVVLAALLVHVINERAFGWSMELLVQPGVLAGGLLLALAAALLAGVPPALRLARAPLAAALREE